ncbi:MAG: ribonuclease P protein component [Candidatus Peregrinibacteria bacterium]
MIAKKYTVDRNLIDYILKKGESFTSKLFIIRYARNNKKFYRYTVIVSTKIDSSSVARNKIKRRIYEAIRRVENEKPESKKENFDIILIPKKQIKDKDFNEIEQDIGEIINSTWKN